MSYETQAGYGVATNEIKKQPRLAQMSERLEKTLNHAAELGTRIDNLANRLVGSVPEAVEAQKDPPTPIATVSVMERQIEYIGQVLTRINQNVARLENL
jgi:hypothetical protein